MPTDERKLGHAEALASMAGRLPRVLVSTGRDLTEELDRALAHVDLDLGEIPRAKVAQVVAAMLAVRAKRIGDGLRVEAAARFLEATGSPPPVPATGPAEPLSADPGQSGAPATETSSEVEPGGSNGEDGGGATS